MRYIATFLACMAGIAFAPSALAVDVDDYIKKDRFEDIKLSPNGDYYAATVPMEDRTALVILRRSDNKVTARVAGGRHSAVADFDWVSPKRVLVSLAEKFGALASPLLTGELYGIDAEGGDGEILVGWRASGNGPGTHIRTKSAETIAAFLVDDLPADEKNVIISVEPFVGDPYTRAEQMDVNTGHRVVAARAPVRNAEFYTDNAGVVRFAYGFDADRVKKLYYRKGNGAEWQLITNEYGVRRTERPIGFSEDNGTAYLQSEQPDGPDAIIAMDLASGERKPVLRDDDSDPERIVFRAGTRIPVGVFFMDGKPRTEFFDKTSREASLYRILEASFGGDPLRITSQTSDGKLALVQVWSDRNPGDFYIFDTVAKKAVHLLSRGDWFDLEKLATMKPIQVKARDGLVLNGYVTLPQGSSGKNLPVVVLPHGGPYGVRDVWGFDNETQMLADAGYAVLQVNYRGSAGYGAAFTHAGARQWGLQMQDDVTDATRWAIDQGIADPKRICIYGASYGGYAALMGAVREPALYQCAAGYVGVYDLPTMHTDGDIQQRGSGETYLREWIGERTELGQTSPSRLADQIKVPVFLAAGGEDRRAPIKHTKMMEQALRKAGGSVESLYYDDEGHGFYLEAHRREYYSRLLGFLAKHLGGSTAAVSSASTTAK